MSKLITLTTSALVAVIGLISFVLSYHALQGVASINGLSDWWLSHLWPLLIDLALIVFSLCVVVAHLHNESTWRQWGMVIGCTLATTGYNYLHAPANIIAQSVAIVPPVMLFFSFELLMMQLKNSIARAAKKVEVTQALTQEVQVLTQEVATLQQAVDDPLTARRQLVAGMLGSKSQRLIAGELGVSVSTVRSDIKALSEKAGLIHKNGHGWEVIP